MDVLVAASEQRAARFRPTTARLVAAITVTSFLVFTLVQIAVTYRYFHMEQSAWARFPTHHNAFDPSIQLLFRHPTFEPVWLRQPYVGLLGWSMLRFAVALSLCMALAAWGSKRFFWLPLVIWSLGPVFFGLGPNGVGQLGAQPPFALGFWWPTAIGPHPWVGMAVDLPLVMIPALPIALRGRTRRALIRPEGLQFACFALCLGVFVLWQSTAASTSGNPAPWTFDLARVLPLFVIGAILGPTRRTLGILAGTTLLYWLWWRANVTFEPQLSAPAPVLFRDFLSFAGAVVLGSSWRPLAAALDRARRRPVLLLAIANGLNLADAVATWAFVRSGQVVESNPIVRGIGLPSKVVLVGLVTWLLYRIRPRSLVWPILVLTAVMAWDVAGIVLSHYFHG